jgi:peptidoglycan/LPS O-acetylase OafA/YrhL
MITNSLRADVAPIASAPSGPTHRFTFLDALRGIAATGVAAFHISRYGPVAHAAEEAIPAWLEGLLKYGWVGVQIFFVLSGFVIAYSLRATRVTPAFVAQFAVRRSLRLDPAYWTTIMLVLLLTALVPSIFYDPNLESDPVSFGQLAAHLFYLQNILGLGNISVGFWTLCIEVQFYLALIGALCLAQWIAGSEEPVCRQDLMRLSGLLALPALMSLFVSNLNQSTDSLLIHFFCMFYLGILACWCLEGKVRDWVFWTYASAMVLRLGWHWSLDICVALVTGIAIYIVGRRRHLGDWLNFSWLQYLGRISYSLYLIHYPVACIITAIGYELTGTSPMASALWLAVALAVSIVAAGLLYRAVESPSLELSRRVGALWSPNRARQRLLALPGR